MQTESSEFDGSLKSGDLVYQTVVGSGVSRSSARYEVEKMTYNVLSKQWSFSGNKKFTRGVLGSSDSNRRELDEKFQKFINSEKANTFLINELGLGRFL